MVSLRTQSPARALLAATLATTLLALAVLLVAAPLAAADLFTPESGGSSNADQIDTLYKIVLFVAIPIFLLVEGALIWTLVKHRARRGGPEPAQIHGNTPLEIGWTIGAAVIVTALAVVTLVFLDDIKNPPASGPNGLAGGLEVAAIDQAAPPKGSSEALTINVNAQQYLWRYDYPDDGVFNYHELVVPINTTVVLKIHASDVIHSWWIPKLGGKADAVPGFVNDTWFKITEPGIYQGQCAELCGSGHADMRARVRAVQPEEYQAFLSQQKDDIAAARKGLAEQRAERDDPDEGARPASDDAESPDETAAGTDAGTSPDGQPGASRQ